MPCWKSCRSRPGRGLEGRLSAALGAERIEFLAGLPRLYPRRSVGLRPCRDRSRPAAGRAGSGGSRLDSRAVSAASGALRPECRGDPTATRRKALPDLSHPHRIGLDTGAFFTGILSATGPRGRAECIWSRRSGNPDPETRAAGGLIPPLARTSDRHGQPFRQKAPSRDPGNSGRTARRGGRPLRRHPERHRARPLPPAGSGRPTDAAGEVRLLLDVRELVRLGEPVGAVRGPQGRRDAATAPFPVWRSSATAPGMPWCAQAVATAAGRRRAATSPRRSGRSAFDSDRRLTAVAAMERLQVRQSERHGIFDWSHRCCQVRAISITSSSRPP